MLTLARALRGRGHDVFFLISGWNDGDFARRLADAGFPAKQIFLGKLSKSFRPRAIKWTADCLVHLPGARRAVAQHLREFRPDALLINHRDWILMLRRQVQGQRSVFHVHELPEDSWWARTSYRKIGATVQYFAAVSENIASRLRALGVSPEKTRVIRNGVDFSSPYRPNGSPDRYPTIGIVGQIGDWKGHGELLSALRSLHEDGTEYRCRVIGRGDATYVENLKSAARKYGIDHLIAWEGYLSDVETIYRDLDICVVPSKFDDPFPTVAIEASLRGIPVVASRRGGLPEIVVDGATGFLTESGNVSELAARLGELLKDPALRHRLGEAARTRALHHFTAARMAEDMEKLLASAAT